jgi:hypothetical protein
MVPGHRRLGDRDTLRESSKQDEQKENSDKLGNLEDQAKTVRLGTSEEVNLYRKHVFHPEV